jgi:hypothetical protein
MDQVYLPIYYPKKETSHHVTIISYKTYPTFNQKLPGETENKIKSLKTKRKIDDRGLQVGI